MSSTTQFRGGAAAPSTCALAAGLGWSLYDAFALAGADHSIWRAWALSAAVACLVALVAVPAAVAVRWIWRRPAWGGRLRSAVSQHPARATAIVVVAMVSLAALGAGTFAIQVAARAFFGSDMVRLLAVAGGVPALAALVGALAWRAGATVTARFERLAPRALAAIAVGLPGLLVLGAALAFPWIAPKVWEELALSNYVAAPIIFAAAIAGLLVSTSKRAVVSTGLLAAATLVLGAAHLLTPVPDHLRKALEVRPSGSGFVLAMLPDASASASRRSGERRSAGEGGASCFPGVDPTPADAIGQIEGGAPDIIFITVDALRWDHTTLSGYDHETTPHIAEHAKDAAVFEQAYSPASNTRQSFRGFFTGIYSSLVESPPSTKWGTSFADGQETMASYLSAAGYQTIALSSRDRAFPAQHGALNGFEVIDETPIPLEEDTGHSVSYKVDRIISHLSEPDEQRPRFIWTHLMESHQPYPAGPSPRRFDTGRYRRYDSAIHFVDGELKRLLDFARGPTRIKDTIVVLTADHGQAFKEHGNRLHGSTVYQEEIHVPLIFWGPGIEPRRFDTPVSGIDILPTLLGSLDLEVPRALCGANLSGALLDGRDPPRSPVYVENVPDDTRDYFGAAFIDGSVKLMVYPSSEVVELYDLGDDPAEKHDLSKEQPDKLRDHLKALRSFYEEREMDPAFYRLDALTAGAKE